MISVSVQGGTGAGSRRRVDPTIRKCACGGFIAKSRRDAGETRCLRCAEEWFVVLADKNATFHIPNDDGEPSCGYDGDVTRREHRVTWAGIWCMNCWPAARASS